MTFRHIIGICGAALLIGTAGASDFNRLEISRVIIQSLVGLGMMAAGARKENAENESNG